MHERQGRRVYALSPMRRSEVAITMRVTLPSVSRTQKSKRADAAKPHRRRLRQYKSRLVFSSRRPQTYSTFSGPKPGLGPGRRFLIYPYISLLSLLLSTSSIHPVWHSALQNVRKSGLRPLVRVRIAAASSASHHCCHLSSRRFVECPPHTSAGSPNSKG